MNLNELKRQKLQQRLELLAEQYKAAHDQRNAALSATDKLTIDEKIRQLEQEISQVEAELAALGGNEQGDATPRVATERPAEVEPKADEAHGAAESVPAPRPTIQTPQEPSRNWIGIVAALIALVGTLAVAYATFTGGERGATALQMTATAEAIPAGIIHEFGGIPFVYVPEGDFWIMQTEVTNAMWQRFIDAGGYDQKSFWSDDGWLWRIDSGIAEPEYTNASEFNGPQQPVVGISWYEAEAYTNWFSNETDGLMRLPDDGQWELACASSDGYTYPWGNEPVPSATLLNFDGNVGRATDVGSYPGGASSYGVLDMAGNVFEWTESTSVRGGSWARDDTYVRCTRLITNVPHERSSDLGFRVVHYETARDD